MTFGMERFRSQPCEALSEEAVVVVPFFETSNVPLRL